ncbi:sodium-dependent glucose transporter 1A-like [Argopecten irradians]|uniref:sodium-dependent glucose transporter 1A-like n=1 Tax=Argopecten irradians TaxID=31199 RepID=UPI0037199260
MDKEGKYGVRSADNDSAPMQDDDTKSKRSLCYEIRNSTAVRSLIARSIAVSGAYMILGWTKGQIGPAFPDIMMISGTDLTKGSTFMTSLYAGQLVGSVLGGFIYSEMNKYILFTAALVLYSFTIAAIPWCSLYGLMVAAFAFLGVCGGVFVVGIGSESVTIWGPTTRGRSYIMANSGAYAISSVLAPLVTAPFLLKQPVNYITITNKTTKNTTHPLSTWPISTNLSHPNNMNISLLNSTSVSQEDSRLYLAFTISAVLSLIIALFFFILYCQQSPGGKQTAANSKLDFIGTRSLFLKRLQLINIGVFSILQNAIDFTFVGYLATFCIQYMNWTKSLGASITSVAFFTRLLGTASGVFLVKYMRPHIIILSSTVISTAGFICLTLSAVVHFDIGVWISICSIGIPFGLLWPIMLSWINENLIPVQSEISGFLNATAFTGALVAPIFIGYMMEEISLLWFCYLFCIKSVVITGNAVWMFFYTTSDDTT